MAVAYVLEQNTFIRMEGERFLVQRKKDVLHTIHIFKLDQLVLFGNVSLTPPVIKRLLKEGIDTVFMSRNGRYLGRLQSPFSKNITLRCKQYEKMSDPVFSTKMAKAIVGGKLANMRTVLMRINRNRKEARLDDNILGIKKIAEKVPAADDLDAVRGYEGKASAVYFEGFSRGFLAEGVTFKKRIRRPPTDPVNALLSLGYTLLFNSVMGAVSLVGFDPYLGALHSVDYGRPSLALDLMEEWRPLIVDTLVLSVFNMKTLTLDDFEKGNTTDDVDIHDVVNEKDDSNTNEGNDQEGSSLPIKLTNSGFRKFILQFERKMSQKVKHHITGQQLSYRDCIREQIRQYARVIRDEEDRYQPITSR
ncbi:MAG: CRISPR-associated endonuclease Cas1 [Deltaproteobacteria bacterium]|nr:CRISPR-associated endonuclease Cas1 [Deltaproteobacteria bacterium]MBW1927828.1 CRISPR-associated endonuclease Cas1 [Deltaproteobacteria bacterium]MBW2026715.1 CRISPR-associated endonuclease Cas1 [Deltaproteobacteria bacterium]MBW2126567.1 CRISPR-associated endonuclease Cas1 [Deltaproteobacteria bacterium]